MATEQISNLWKWKYGFYLFSALYSLEEDWTDVVGHESALGLDEKTRSQQTALWELVETEVAYIRTLKVIQDVSSEMTSSYCLLFKWNPKMKLIIDWMYITIYYSTLEIWFNDFQLFLNCLCNLQSNHILTEIDVERLFCNIPEIYAANRVRIA